MKTRTDTHTSHPCGSAQHSMNSSCRTAKQWPMVATMAAALSGLSMSQALAESESGNASSAGAFRTIAIDGDFSDWEGLAPSIENTMVTSNEAFVDLGNVWVAYDYEWIYLRVQLGDEVNLHGLDGSIKFEFDFDGNPLTGAISTTARPPQFPAMVGMDFMLEFSPTRRNSRGETRNEGVRAALVNKGQPEVPMNPYRMGASFAPTFASNEIELRLARGVRVRGSNVPAFGSTGFNVRLVATQFETILVDQAGPFHVELRTEEDQEADSESAIHVRPSDAQLDTIIRPMRRPLIRFVSWNVERGNLFKDSERFARILNVLHPDVICFQELGDEATNLSLKDWLQSHLNGRQEWEVVLAPSTGTAVATRHSGVRAGPREMPAVEKYADGKERLLKSSIQLVGARQRRVIVSSVHLKCCGSIGGSADQTRMDEAQMLNSMLAEAVEQDEAFGIVIMGDLNLVGSREPLEVLRSDIDLNGTELAVLEPRILNEHSFTTWRDPDQPFLPGRLDFALVSDSTIRVLNSFVFDSEHLSDSLLDRLGLSREDTTLASDHLPVVADVIW